MRPEGARFFHRFQCSHIHFGLQARRSAQMPIAIHCAFATLMVLSTASVAAGASSTFDNGADGWTVADWSNPNLTSIVATLPVAWAAAGGNPGGYISASDPSDNWFWFSAPAKFLGNQSGSLGGALLFDLRVSLSDSPQNALVMLVGGGQQLFYSGTSPSTSTFSTYAVQLSPSGWRVGDWQNGPTPSSSAMLAVLSNLTGLYIDGDLHNGVEVASLDNVQLVPEPGKSLLLGLGGLFVCLTARQVRKAELADT